MVQGKLLDEGVVQHRVMSFIVLALQLGAQGAVGRIVDTLGFTDGTHATILMERVPGQIKGRVCVSNI